MTRSLLIVLAVLLSLPAFAQKQVKRTFTVENDATIYIDLISSSDVDCVGNEGSIYIDVHGGVGPLTISWTGPDGFTSSDEDIFGLSVEGYYYVTIDDGNGCPATMSYTINNVCAYICSGLVANITNPIDPSTCSSFDGSFNLEISGGQTPYYYEVRHITLTSTVVFYGFTPTGIVPLSGMQQGTYEIFVQDGKLCETYSSHHFTSPFYLYERYVTGTNTDCTLSNATLNLTVIGAAFPQNLSIKWNNISNTNNPTLTTTVPQLDNAYPGYYVIEVSDLTSGCKIYGDAEVTNYMLRLYPTINAITPATKCLPANGAVDVSVTGGAGSYQYRWSRTDGTPFSASTQDVSGLAPGPYRIEIVDTGAGCTALEDLVVPGNTVNPSVTKTEVPNTRCTSPFNGSVTLSVSGTPGPFSYSWVEEHNYEISTQPSLTQAPAGVYGVTVTDNVTGCKFILPPTDTEAIQILDNSLPSIAIESVVNANKACDYPYSGSIGIELTTSTTYDIQWYGPHDFQSTEEDITDLRDGEYTLMITLPCGNNSPPLIDPPALTVENNTSLTIDLLEFISDPDNNLDPSTLEILDQPISGATAQINQTHQLLIDYQGITFKGMDQLRIKACDDLDACSENILTIDVDVTATGEIQIFNAIAPNSSGDNKYMRILNVPQENRVSIYNRWGDKVFEVNNYDNQSRKFDGTSDNGKQLPSGTYFYRIELPNGAESLTGYLSLKQ